MEKESRQVKLEGLKKLDSLDEVKKLTDDELDAASGGAMLGGEEGDTIMYIITCPLCGWVSPATDLKGGLEDALAIENHHNRRSPNCPNRWDNFDGYWGDTVNMVSAQ